ncbi:hypothetical protein F5884DRAFT_771129 [Xylogone sp. PMI_703]|nr:hypothetical protein F5884DRAFT_771129 [Xylogone sp. PMI_703]
MTTSHSVFASTLHGYLCRTCFSRLYPLKYTPGQLRNVATGPKRAKRNLGDIGQKSQQEPRVTIKFFEQTQDGTRKEMRDGAQTEEAIEAAINAKIRALDAELERIQTGQGRGRSRPHRSGSIKPIVKASLDSEADKPVSSKAGSESTPILVDPENIAIPVENIRYVHIQNITRLNSMLKRSWNKSSVSHDVQKATWKLYSMCRDEIISSAQFIPLGVWYVLWGIFDIPLELGGSLDRMAHIKCLAEDMERVGISLNAKQLLCYLEAEFICGNHIKAISRWEEAKGSLGENPSLLKDFWELGIRMFCQMGKIDEALKAADFLMNCSDKTEAAVIIQPLIKACLSSNSEHATQKAWALYIRLRVYLATQIAMEDFDAVISALLEADQVELALGVFKDMMLLGNKNEIGQDSVQLYKVALGTQHNLKTMQIGDNELHWKEAKVLVSLPTNFNNKFFFGSWIKKLIGEGNLEGASKVFDFMRYHGITPDARHLNGLIGAWLRTGKQLSQQKAEDTAWKMIEARLEFVRRREMRSELVVPLQAVFSSSKLDHRSIIPPVPKATIETFSILVEYYRRRQKQEKLLDLYDTLRKAQIRPDTFFMNQLLLSDLRSHRRHWAWSTYNTIVKGAGVRPDLDTYACLWQLIKKAKDPVLTREWRRDNFTTCRHLFAEMVQRASSLTEKEQFPRDLYDLIIVSFGLSDDQPGTAVALRALQQYFDIYPNQDTVRSIILQLARVGHVNAAGIQPRRLNINNATRERINKVTRVLETLRKTREDILLNQGIIFNELDNHGKLEESILLLSDLLRYVSQSRIIDNNEIKDVSQLSLIAAKEMGVPDCVPWEPNT